MKRSAGNQGQALLLVVLAVAVMTTVGLSVASRSISDVTLTTREEESLRAFSAAEAGVEEALISGLTSGTLPEGATFSVTSSGFPDAAREYIYPAELDSGEAAVVWLAEHDEDYNLISPSYRGSSITVCWGREGTSASDVTTPAVEVEILYEEAGEIHVARSAYDPYSSRRSSNNFLGIDGGGCTVDGRTFAFRRVLDMGSSGFDLPWSVDGALKLVKVRMLYNNTPQILGVVAEEDLPSQGLRVESLGVFGQSSRRVEVFSLYPEPMSVFGAALYSNDKIQ